ncbi:DUF4145 domain-containing protein [Oceanobacillus caeni]|uniref:DUF4145 domain-containing protein n=1 Tax=Virgibacillus sp. SK37 TaxID=403957 RepID=UPI0011A671DC|nr:DUF4145 domain-containing protein [Virgibacillus sp. SK37]
MNKLEEKVYCTNCKNKTHHGIVHTYSERSDIYDDMQWHDEYHIVKCLGCYNVSFVRQYGDEDMWEQVNGERFWVDEFTAYPGEPKEEYEEGLLTMNRQPKEFKHTPNNILDLYNQIIESFNNLHFVLCVSGLRTLIEGICSQQGIKKGYIYDCDKNKLPNKKDGVVKKSESLGGRIFGLFENDHILFHQALLLQKVKDIGNSAIHDIEVPDIYTIYEIISVVEEAMSDIYELKNHKLLQDD